MPPVGFEPIISVGADEDSSCLRPRSHCDRPTQDKVDNVKDSFYEELDRVFDKYHMKFLLGDFNAIVRKTFLNQQLGMNIYTKLVMIMELE
jgi:hypothetical protein